MKKIQVNNKQNNMTAKKTTSASTDVGKNKNMAAFSYVWIICLYPLLMKKGSKFAQFHAKQGFVLLILSIFTVVPFFGQLLMLALVIVSIMGIIKAVNGEWWEIPFVYEWSKKINL